MEARRVNDHLSVAPQISVGDIAEIAAAGYRSIICNRPDGEDPGQPEYSQIEAEARRHDLEIRWQPIVSGAVGPHDGEQLTEMLDELPKPALVYCRSGTRSITAWCLGQAGRRPTAQIIADAQAAGYDLAGLAPHLDALASARGKA